MNFSETQKLQKNSDSLRQARQTFFRLLSFCLYSYLVTLIYSTLPSENINVSDSYNAIIGGHCEDRITKQTNFLIVGDMDYKKGLEGYESSKLRKAKQLIADKQDLQILPESAFYDLVSDYLNGI